MVDYERYERWVTKSFRWIREDKDKHLPHHIQMLGIVDAELRGVRSNHIFNDDGTLIEDEYQIV